MKKPSKSLRFAYIIFLIFLGVLAIAAIAQDGWFYFDFYKGFWPFGTGFDLAEYSIEETIFYAILPFLLYKLWQKLED